MIIARKTEVAATYYGISCVRSDLHVVSILSRVKSLDRHYKGCAIRKSDPRPTTGIPTHAYLEVCMDIFVHLLINLGISV